MIANIEQLRTARFVKPAVRLLPGVVEQSEESKIRVWLAQRRDEFNANNVDLRNKGNDFYARQVRLAMLIEQGEHVLANYRAGKIVQSRMNMEKLEAATK